MTNNIPDFSNNKVTILYSDNLPEGISFVSSQDFVDATERAKEAAKIIEQKIRIDGLTHKELRTIIAQYAIEATSEGMILKAVTQELQEQLLSVFIYEQTIPPAQDVDYEEIKD